MPETRGRQRIDFEEYLGHQRWFAGKGRSWRVGQVTTVAHLREPGPDVTGVRIDVVQVTYDDGETETYQLPLVLYPEPAPHLSHAYVGEEVDDEGRLRVAYDALHDKDCTGLWVEGIAGSGRGPSWAFHREPTATELPPGGPSIVIGAEQSNTSLVFGDSLILKVFRKVSPGLNPDIEMHGALAAAGSTHIAAPLGWLEGTWEDPSGGQVTASLAMAQAFLKGATDGWELALTSVRDLYAEALRRAFDDVAGLEEPVHVQRVHGDYHLGQVMRTLDGWVLLDFEGEPARPLAERRALESPVKDVAGMLRSFDYAARHLLADHPGDAQRAYRAGEWADRNRDAFLDGYARAGGRDPREQPVLLRAFETDKAVYEVLYEARNRPTWLQIPMAAIHRLATAEE
jgi:maltokinase